MDVRLFSVRLAIALVLGAVIDWNGSGGTEWLAHARTRW
jgi:hypothetical protein